MNDQPEGRLRVDTSDMSNQEVSHVLRPDVTHASQGTILDPVSSTAWVIIWWKGRYHQSWELPVPVLFGHFLT